MNLKADCNFVDFPGRHDVCVPPKGWSTGHELAANPHPSFCPLSVRSSRSELNSGTAW